MLKGSEEKEEAAESESDDSSDSDDDSDNEAEVKEEAKDDDVDNEGDELMKVEESNAEQEEDSKERVELIQARIEKQVLPIIERHLSEEGAGKREDNGNDCHFRSFVVVCYAKAIRKLPAHSFKRHLQKLINMIVVHGLRARELSYREKARKAMHKLIQEVTPFFLKQAFEEMRTHLTRGY